MGFTMGNRRYRYERLRQSRKTGDYCAWCGERYGDLELRISMYGAGFGKFSEHLGCADIDDGYRSLVKEDADEYWQDEDAWPIVSCACCDRHLEGWVRATTDDEDVWTRFCSDRCYDTYTKRWRRRKAEQNDPAHFCEQCGESMETDARRDRRFCSGRCRTRRHRGVEPVHPSEADPEAWRRYSSGPRNAVHDLGL